MVLKSQAELAVPSSAVATHPFDIPNTSVVTIHLVPGGRWLLVGCRDGSVWYYDLDPSCSTNVKFSPQAGRPRLLLESPLATQQASKNLAGVFIAIDHTSQLVNSSESPFKVLESFNLAVAVTIKPAGVDSAAHSFQVWRVDVVTGRPDREESTKLKPLQRLSSFKDACSIINDISIHDFHFAYCLAYPPGATVIVDWRSVNEKAVADDPDRWHLDLEETVSVSRVFELPIAEGSSTVALQRIFLLPGDLLYIIGYEIPEVTLWKWRQSAARSSHSGVWEINPSNPFWLYKLPGIADYVYNILPPITVNGMLHCVAPTARFGVFQISIPNDGNDVASTSITCRRVYAGKLLRAEDGRSPLGYRYGLAYNRSSGWAKISYQQDLRENGSASSVDLHIIWHPPKNPGDSPDPPLRVVTLDEISHRVVTSNLSTFSFFDLALPNYYC
jgi:hypothetical protein